MLLLVLVCLWWQKGYFGHSFDDEDLDDGGDDDGVDTGDTTRQDADNGARSHIGDIVHVGFKYVA